MFRKVFFLLFFSQFVFADIEDLEQSPFDSRSNETLFVSLGSHCNPSHVLRACSLRKAAFPLDWICSFDIESVIDLLNTDFQYFLDDNYLAPVGKTTVLNLYSHLEFLHDGDFGLENYKASMIKFKEKYQRRIDRFTELFNYPGKVVFIRESYREMYADRARHFYFDDNEEISEENALRLFKALKIRFPILNFALVIVNHGNENQIVMEKNIRDELYFIRAIPKPVPAVAKELYQPFFEGFR